MFFVEQVRPIECGSDGRSVYVHPEITINRADVTREILHTFVGLPKGGDRKR